MSLAVLFVHNRYQTRGGEDSVFDTESALFESRGHRVARFEMNNADLPASPSATEKVMLAAKTIWSRDAQKRLQEVIADFQPDVIHFHNTLPQISPAALRTAHESGAAVLQTLHNFRLVCPSGLMYRDGKPCESCLHQPVPVSSVIHACYRGSRAQSATVAAMTAVHRAAGTWTKHVDLFLSPSQFLKEKVVEGGIPAEKVMIKPNFVYPDPQEGTHQGDFVLFAGRLTQTKGIETLLRAYETNSEGLPPLVIAGGGDLEHLAEAAAVKDSRISFLGMQPREEILGLMGHARALVFPSVWYENFPMAITEALGRGLPVVSSHIGALPEMVQDGVNGLLFEPGDANDLATKLRTIAAGGIGVAAMGQAARHSYTSQYSVERGYELLLTAYLRAARKPRLILKQTSEAGVI